MFNVKIYIKAAIVYLFVLALLIVPGAAYADDADKAVAPAPVTSESVAESTAPKRERPDNSYRLGASDSVKITVFGESDLSSTFVVKGDGTISYPLIGEISVQGLNARDVEKLLYKELSDGYLVNPSISVEIASFRPFYILGEVRAPGSYSYSNGITILKAVALAGGFTYRANKKHVQILKTRESGSELYDKTSVNAPISPGDIILVKERFF